MYSKSFNRRITNKSLDKKIYTSFYRKSATWARRQLISSTRTASTPITPPLTLFTASTFYLFLNQLIDCAFERTPLFISTQRIIYLTSIFSAARTKIKLSFKSTPFPEDIDFLPLLFGDAILYTKDVERLVTSSVYTNSLQDFEYGRTRFVPEASLSFLECAAKRGDTATGSEFSKLMDRLIERITDANEAGDALENILQGILYLRLYTAIRTSTKIQLSRLFGCEKLSGLPDYLTSYLQLPKSAIQLMSTLNTALPSLRGMTKSNKANFYDFFEELAKNPSSLGVWKSAKQDVCDVVVMVRLEGRDHPFFIFMELKSREVRYEEEGSGASSLGRDIVPENGRQFRKFKDCMTIFAGRYPQSVLANPQNYVYAYLTTDERINTFSLVDKSSENANALVIGGKEAAKLLGIFEDLYRAQRSVLGNKPRKEKARRIFQKLL